MARPPRRPGNLPAEAASFVGRRRELAEVRKKLAETRLVSLVGPGGVGKTRLASRAAADLARGFRDGGWLVELAEVTDPGLVSHAVMAALDLRDQAAAGPLALLRDYLRDSDLLLVVDNCEHLAGPVGRLVADLMRAAPGLRVIATSREPLSVPGEYVVPVPPLALPAPGAAESLAQLRQNEAVSLFTERAAAASGTFELTAANQAAVADLVRRLDGLPLAIELAAVRTRVLAPEQILDRLADRFALLTGGSRAALPRHQTLRTTIEWSHDLLSAAERAVLRRCCVFAGRFTLDDVEAVCASADASAPETLDVLSSLVGKSLVTKEETRSLACYRLHETMREFARLKLAEAVEEEATELRCAGYYRARCAQSAREGRYRLLDWLTWADLEIDNIRAVLRRCLDRGDTVTGLHLSASLGWYWITRATSEGIRWLEEFVAARDTADADPQVLGWAQFMRGFLAVLKADPAAAGPPLHAAVAVARQTGQRELLSEALSMAAVVANMAGDRAEARRLLGEADAVAASLGRAYPSGLIAVLQARARDGFFAADPGAVRAAAGRAASLARETGDLYALEIMLLNLGSAALLDGELGEAKPLLTEALRIAREIDDRVAQFYLLAALGCHAAEAGQPRLAARLIASADAERTGAGANVMPFLAPALARATESAAATLGPARFAAESEAGRHLGRDAALNLALGQPAQAASPGTARPGTPAPGPLGPREADVARLVADGLTNKQIGTRLFISERTVDSHVRSILNKLGFSSRAQIAAWMVTDPLAAVPQKRQRH
jgi:predicted ATPase/DNA-binding CsgD family transcriptional regulator